MHASVFAFDRRFAVSSKREKKGRSCGKAAPQQKMRKRQQGGHIRTTKSVQEGSVASRKSIPLSFFHDSRDLPKSQRGPSIVWAFWLFVLAT